MRSLRGGQGSLGGPTGEAAIGVAPIASVGSAFLLGLGGLHTLGSSRFGSGLQSMAVQDDRALAFLQSKSSEVTSRFTVLTGGVTGSPRVKDAAVELRLYGDGVAILGCAKHAVCIHATNYVHAVCIHTWSALFVRAYHSCK